MIPATHVHDDGDGTAWVVFGDDDNERDFFPAEWVTDLDRPCDLCNGTSTEYRQWPYPCHCIAGRHTFDIEVDTGERDRLMHWPVAHTYRVSIIPGMILPIVRGACPAPTNAPHRPAHVHLAEPSDDNQNQSGICKEDCDLVWDNPWKSHNLITLPAAARPGMWAVKVRIA